MSDKDMPFILYAMECEGDIPTHKGKINKFIKLLHQYNCDYDPLTQEHCARLAGINFELTEEEKLFIEKEVWGD